METFLLIVQIILLLSLSILAMYLVVLLIKVKGLLGTVEVNLKEITTRAVPVLENIEVITSKLRTITESVDDQLLIVKSSVQSLKSIVDNIRQFEQRIQSYIETPALEVAASVGTIIRGITSMIRKFKG